MRFPHACILFAALSLLAGCDTMNKDMKGEKESPDKKKYYGASFTCRVQKGVTPVVDQGENHAVHYFRLDGTELMMGVYEGLKPKLFWPKGGGDLTVQAHRHPMGKANVARGDDVYGVDSNGKYCRESVWECERPVQPREGKAFHVPTMIHIWYFGATQDQAIAFDAIAETIEITTVKSQ